MHSEDRLHFLGSRQNSACNVLSLHLRWGRVWLLVILPVEVLTSPSHHLHFYPVDAIPGSPETSCQKHPCFCNSSVFLSSLILDCLPLFLLFASVGTCWIPFVNKSQSPHNLLLLMSICFPGLPISHVIMRKSGIRSLSMENFLMCLHVLI